MAKQSVTGKGKSAARARAAVKKAFKGEPAHDPAVRAAERKARTTDLPELTPGEGELGLRDPVVEGAPPPQGTMKTRKREATQEAFLELFADNGNVSKTCTALGMSRTAFYRWMREDPTFPQRLEQAELEASRSLEDEARRRAYEGVLEPVFYKGIEVGYVRKYSDVLLIFLLKGLKPSRYRENVDLSVGGKKGAPAIGVDVRHGLSDATADELRRKVLGIEPAVAPEETK